MRTITSGFLMLVFLTSSAFAQERNFSAVGGVGVSFPVKPDDFKDFQDKGISISGGLYYSLNDHIKIGIQSGRYNFNLDSSDLPTGFSISGGDGSVFILMPSIRLTASSSGRFVPFVQAGLGYFRADISDVTVGIPVFGIPVGVTVEADDGMNSFGYMVGGGVEVALNNRSSLVLESGLIVGQTEHEVTMLIPVELKYLFRW